MKTKLGVTSNEQGHMVRHDLDLHKFLSPVLNGILNEPLEAVINPINKNLAPVLRTPHSMVVTIIHDRCVAVNFCLHADSVAENSRLSRENYLCLFASPVPVPLSHKKRPDIPTPEGRGFYGRL
jgi:hypothetical protein